MYVYIFLTRPLISRLRFISHLRHALFWRLRFMIRLKHPPPSVGDSGSSYILDWPPDSAIRIHQISQTHALIWRFCFITSSTCPLFLPCQFIIHPHVVAIRTHHTSQTRPLFWRFRFIIYLEHAISFGDSDSSHILSRPPFLAISVHHILMFMYLKHAPSFGCLKHPPPPLAITQ